MRISNAALLFTIIAALHGCDDRAAHAADDTGKNKRDAEGAYPTPADQSNAKDDLAITKAIREAIVEDDSLSMAAENVKIITDAGVVTLRGPVKSAEEKTVIEAYARGVAGVLRVDNQLEIAR